MFKITGGKGFSMKFANGWTVSVQFGPGNYCDNRHMPIDSESDRLAGKEGSTNAEIAAWDADGNWHNFGDDTVCGWCSTDDVANFIAQIANK
jgi:hypothetical protein